MPPETAPRSLLIKPASGDCNLHCAYCFYHNRPTDPYREGGTRRHRMSAEVLDALIRQGMALDRRQATFGWQGGEPTLCGLPFFQQAVALQQKYGANGQSVSNGLQTNALLLDRDWARFLRQYNFLLGVSLDGPAAYHDAYRQYLGGAPSHERVVASLRLLAEYHVEYNILAVVNRLTGDHPAEIYDYFVAQGWGFLQFIPCVEVDPATGQPTDFTLRPGQFGDFLCALFDRWYGDGEPQVSIRDFDAMLAVYLGQEAPMCCYQERCGDYLVVEHNGDLYPCDFFVRDDLRIGNILTMPLEQAFASEAVARFGDAKAAPRRECAVCAWAALCQQGCPRFLGVGGSPRHYLCRDYQQFYHHSHERFLALRDHVLARQGVRQAPPDPRRPVGRNAPCWCGSGKKFKQCCGRQAA